MENATLFGKKCGKPPEYFGKKYRKMTKNIGKCLGILAKYGKIYDIWQKI